MSLTLDLLVHAANVLYLVAFMVRDILWFRILAVVAALCLIAYLYSRPDPLMASVYWNLVFTAVNVYWIGRLLLERRPLALSAAEQRLCELVFRTMTPREMTALLKLATWESAKAGECFVQRDQPLNRLMVIYSGRACADVDGRTVAELQPGHFIGSISYVTGKRRRPMSWQSSRRATCPGPNRSQGLHEEEPGPALGAPIDTCLDLTRWLHATWAHGASHGTPRTDSGRLCVESVPALLESPRGS
jgi:hypothetical protein